MKLRNKKILYVVNVDWFFISHRLPLALEAIKRGYEVCLITKNTGRFKELQNAGLTCFELEFERSGKNPFKEIGLIIKLRKFYKLIQPDIIHHITLKPSIYGTIAAKGSAIKAKIVNAVSGLGYTFTANRQSLSKLMLLALLRYAFHDRCSNFIFQNPDDLNYYRSLRFLDFNNYIIIKGAGVDEQEFTSNSNMVSSEKVKIILVARMLKDKGVFEFIMAANILKKKYFEFLEFILVGGIDLYNPAAIKEETLNCMCDGKYLKWIGQQSNVKDIYANADIVCLPSYREGLPKSLVEAMSMSLPIITTDAIGCRECVVNGDNGFLIPIGDHLILSQRIEQLALDKKLRLKMGKRSREIMINEMSLSHVISKTFDFYGE
jgi:glycosyltransferase involved in cell wall biosynthesis